MKKSIFTTVAILGILFAAHSAFAVNAYDYQIMTRNGANNGNILTYVAPVNSYGLIGNNPLSSPNANLPILYSLGNRLSFNTGTNAIDVSVAGLFPNPTGTTSQFLDGTGALQTSKTLLSQFTNDSGFITNSDLSGYALISSLGTAAFQPTSAFATSAQGTLASTALQSITSGNVTTALGYTPYNSTNPSGYITSASIPAQLYQTYQASVTQTGTSAPTGTQLANNFSGSPTFTWARTGVGTYTVTASSAVFTSNKTKVFFGQLNSALGYITATVTSTTVITINTQLTSILSLILTTGNADALMTATPINIQVYP